MKGETWARRVRRATVTGLVSAAVVASGCSDLATAPALDIPAAVSIAPQTITVESIGEEVTFQAQVFDRAGRELSGVPLVWEVSDPAVLEPTGVGTFRSKGLGTVQVQARVAAGTPGVDPDGFHSGRGPSGEALVEVDQKPSQILLNAEALRFWALDQGYQLEAEVVDALGTPMLTPVPITWSVEPGGEGVVTLNPDGWARATADGTARVLASAGGASAGLDVEVSATVRYDACFSFTLGSGGPPITACAMVETVVREPEA